MKVVSDMLNKHNMLDNPEYLEAVWTCMVYVAETKLLARQAADQAEQLHNILKAHINKYREDNPREATTQLPKTIRHAHIVKPPITSLQYTGMISAPHIRPSVQDVSVLLH